VWEVIEIDGAIHVWPLNDLRVHVGLDCWCRPRDDDSVLVHNSMDRREFVERGEVKPS
jgi:hypothetical protein